MGNAAYRQKHKELGLCVSCSRPAIHGKTRCELHRVQRNKYNQEHKEERAASERQHRREKKAQGLCYKCPRPAAIGTTLCAKHLYKLSMSSKRSYLAHCEERKQRIAARQRRLADEGKCIYCGIPLSLMGDSGKGCLNCLDKRKPIRGILYESTAVY